MFEQTVVIGYLGADPVMKFIQDGKPVTNFRMATTRKWKDASGELQERTKWYSVDAWNKLAETCNTYLSKGSLVLVEGDVEASAFADKDTGEPRASLKLHARNVRFLSTKRNGNGDETPAPESTNGSGEEILF